MVAKYYMIGYTRPHLFFDIPICSPVLIFKYLLSSTWQDTKTYYNHRSKIFGNLIFEMKVVTYPGLNFKHIW